MLRARAGSALLKGEILLAEEQAVLRLGPVTVKAAQKLAVNQEVVSGDLGLAH